MLSLLATHYLRAEDALALTRVCRSLRSQLLRVEQAWAPLAEQLRGSGCEVHREAMEGCGSSWEMIQWCVENQRVSRCTDVRHAAATYPHTGKRLFKAIHVGDMRAGKSSLVQRYTVRACGSSNVLCECQ